MLCIVRLHGCWAGPDGPDAAQNRLPGRMFPILRICAGTTGRDGDWSGPDEEDAMANAPKAAKEKRTPPLDRQNAQGDHEGSAHRPEEFDEVNPARQVPSSGQPAKEE